MKRLLKKTMALSLVFLLLGSQGAQALGPSIPSTSSVIKKVSSWFGIDQDSTKQMTSAASVLQNKGNAPQVKITFSPADPETDEEITAMAAAVGFSATPENLYYTWYINQMYYDSGKGKYMNCDLDVDNPDGTEADRKKYCDYDNDGKVTVHDWKIAAVKLQLANAPFSQQEVCDENGDCDATDEDGYIASFGGEGNAIGKMEEGEYKKDVFSDAGYHDGAGSDSGRAYQYLHDFTGGEDWEFVDDDVPLEDVMAAACGNPSPFSFNGTNENGSWNKVPKCGEGTVLDDEDPIVEAELVYPTISGFLIPLYIGCEDTGESPICTNNEWVCQGGGKAVCAYNYEGAEYGKFLWTQLTGSGDDIQAYTGSCKAHFDEPTPNPDACDERYAIKHATTFHMFPHAVWKSGGSLTEPSCFDSTPNETTGDGKFDGSEECFWGTDPQDPDTLDVGVKDEALIAGQGVQQLTWNYKPGDKVGVIVEGNSMIATKHPDGSQEIQFAMAKNDMSFLLGDDDVEAKAVVQYDNGSDYATTLNVTRGIMTKDETEDALGVDYDFLRPLPNKYMKANLVDPAEGGQAQKLEVSITHSPETPMNMAYADIDGGDELGDTVTLNASVSGAGSSDKQAEFDWSIKVLGTSTKPTRDVFENEDRWADAEGTKIECDSEDIGDCTGKFGLNRLKGGNLNKLELKLDMEEGDFSADGAAYMYVKTIVKQTSDTDPDQTSRNYKKGAAVDIFRIINQGGKQIKVQRVVKAAGDEDLKGETEDICDTGSELVICPVLKNEIVKVDASELEDYESYSWKINGKSMDCDAGDGAIGNCGNDDQKINYFAATGEAGTTYTVKVSAIGGAGNSGQQPKEMQRVFMVVEPKVSFDHGANLKPKTLGSYKDIMSDDPTATIDDESDTVMVGEAGKEVEVKLSEDSAFTEPLYILDMMEEDSKKFEVDGEEQDEGYKFEIGQGGAIGHLLTFSGQYTVSTENRRALKSLWDVGQFDSSGGQVEAKMAIEIDDGGGDADTRGNSGRFLASLINNVPIQFLLVLRIMLTGLVVFVVMAVAFSAVPEADEKKYY